MAASLASMGVDVKDLALITVIQLNVCKALDTV